MNRYVFSEPIRPLIVSLVLVGGTGQAVAALGQAPSVAAPSSATAGVRQLAAAPSAKGLFRVHEVTLETGTTVREYADAAGIVFAVSWNGPVLPDLNELLGGYFTTFESHTEQNRRAGLRRAPVTLSQDGLVLRSMGRMRSFSGSAYAPALIPTGVSIHDVLR
ncbi:MAG: DUF2844 domain-containing protein [Betaproteobacteria bacterium]